MNLKTSNLRRNLLLFTALAVTGGASTIPAAQAQTSAPTPVVVVPGDGNNVAPSDTYEIEKVHIRYKKNLLKEKDLPSAITVLDQKSIATVNPTMGSIQTLLKQSPSVVAYTQGPGQSAPTLAVRGVKNDELAETLNDVPVTSLLGGTGDYLSNNVSGPITLPELDSVTVYPGVAPPEKSGFGTVGGTIAYTAKSPTDDPYAELEGGYGSFDTSHFGFTINTGKWYNDPDAPKSLLLYDQSETAGYVDNTPAHYHNFLFNTVKPFDDGLTQVGLLIIYNQGNGLLQTTPTPTALINSNKWTYNFPTSAGYYNQAGQFLTTILSDKSFINRYLDFQGSVFYMHQTQTTDSYSAPYTTDGSYPYAVNVQAPYNFFGDVSPGSGFDVGNFTYNPDAVFGSGEAGESSEYTSTWGNTVGITPRLNIHLPYNTIAIGGLVAKQTQSTDQYIYGGNGAETHQEIGYDADQYGGGQQRTVYVGYVSDKIDLLNNKLHIEPALRVSAAYTSNTIVQQWDQVPGKYRNFTKVGEPYIGISYDLPYNMTAYATYGKSSLFSPVSDYGEGENPLAGSETAPSPEIVHMYEAGLRYVTPRLYLSADYFYQKVNDAFSFYENYATGQAFYANDGGFMVRGVELAGKFRLNPEFTLSGNFSYNNTDYTNSAFEFVTLANDQFGYAFQGTPFSNTPNYLGNIALDYDSGPWTAEISGQYTGREDESTDLILPNCGTLAASKTPACQLSGATTTDVNQTNDPNFLVNFNASYKIPFKNPRIQSVKLIFTALNILDVHYYTYAYTSEIANAGVYSVNPNYASGLIGPPRSVQLDLVARF